jgi:hypothetical protein
MLIGIIGLKRSGKDTLANYLIQNYNFEKISAADPIKDISRILFPHWDESIIETNKKDEVEPITGIIPRELFKWIGTDIFQYSIYDKFPQLKEYIPPRNIWVNIMEQKYKEITKKGKNVIVPDIRFVHEAEFIVRNQGKLIYLDKFNINKTDKLDYDLNELIFNNDYLYSNHKYNESKNPWSLEEYLINREKWIDYNISNKNTIHDLYKECDKLIKNINNS